MNSHPTLSIITVNLNNRDGLQRTIDSVVNQTFDDYEWIVIDGGSTDGSRELIEQYQDRFAYWCSEPDNGIYNAMNKGIAHARGEWLQFLNSGDWLYDEHTLSKLKLDKQTAEIVFGRIVVNSKTGDFLHGPQTEDLSLFEMIDEGIPHSASFIKKHLFSKFGSYDENYRIVSDMKFFLETIVLNHIKIKFLDLTVSFFDYSGISTINQTLLQKEKESVISELFSHQILADYYHYRETKEQCEIIKNYNIDLKFTTALFSHPVFGKFIKILNNIYNHRHGK